MERYISDLLSVEWQGYVKKSPKWRFFLSLAFIKPDSVQPEMNQVASIINLRFVLPQKVKPPTRFLKRPGPSHGILFEVAAHRDCPFHRDLTRYVSVALIVELPRVAVNHYAVPAVRTFLWVVFLRRCRVQPSYAFSHPR